MTGYIYKIVSKKTGNFYIGSSKNIKTRWRWHYNKLRNNKHHNIHLQHIYNKYGERDLIFLKIEKCTTQNILIREQHYINTYQKDKHLLNVARQAGGGDTISMHPDRENIVKKISFSSKKRYKEGKVSKEFLNSQGRFKPGVDHSGEKNSMYGKTHKESTRSIIGYKTYLRTKFSNNIEKNIICDYNNGVTIALLSKKHNCTTNKIKTLLKYNADKTYCNNTAVN